MKYIKLPYIINHLPYNLKTKCLVSRQGVAWHTYFDIWLYFSICWCSLPAIVRPLWLSFPPKSCIKIWDKINGGNFNISWPECQEMYSLCSTVFGQTLTRKSTKLWNIWWKTPVKTAEHGQSTLSSYQKNMIWRIQSNVCVETHHPRDNIRNIFWPKLQLSMKNNLDRNHCQTPACSIWMSL